jgi:hypothetical protein
MSAEVRINMLTIRVRGKLPSVINKSLRNLWGRIAWLWLWPFIEVSRVLSLFYPSQCLYVQSHSWSCRMFQEAIVVDFSLCIKKFVELIPKSSNISLIWFGHFDRTRYLRDVLVWHNCNYFRFWICWPLYCMQQFFRKCTLMNIACELILSVNNWQTNGRRRKLLQLLMGMLTNRCVLL